MFRRAERVAGVRVLELHHRADVAGAERGDVFAALAVEQENLADAFGDLAVAVEQIRAAAELAGIDAEEGQLAEVRLAHRLENVGDRFAAIEGDFGFVATGVKGGDIFAVHRRRAVFGDEIQEARDADVFFRRGAEERDEQFLLHRRMDAGAEFLLRQAALLKIFAHQAVVGFGDVLDEFAMQRLDLFAEFAGGGFLGVFAGAVGGVGDDLVAQNVERAVEAGAGVHRHAQWKNVPAEMFLRGFQDGVEIRVFLVRAVDDDHFWDAVIMRVIPDAVGAHAEAVVRVNHHQREIADAQRAQAFADEVEVAGRVNDVEFFARPFQVQQRGGDGDLPLLLADVVIGDGRAVGDPAQAADDAGAAEHGFGQHGFAAGGVADDGEVADFSGGVIFHKRISHGF